MRPQRPRGDTRHAAPHRHLYAVPPGGPPPPRAAVLRDMWRGYRYTRLRHAAGTCLIEGAITVMMALCRVPAFVVYGFAGLTLICAGQMVVVAARIRRDDLGRSR